MNADAIKFYENTTPKTTFSYKLPAELLQELSNNLSQNDIKKMYFLCLDLVYPGARCPQTIDELLSLIDGDVDYTALMKELLYHIKKYRILKSLNTCSHNMKVALHDKKFVNEDRLSLFFVCENLVNEQVKQLKHLLNQSPSVTEGWTDVAAEDFLSAWLRQIDYRNMSLLKKKLQEMGCNHLASKLRSEEIHYHVTTPTPGKPCGLALIFDNEVFNKLVVQEYKHKERLPDLGKRDGTKVDEGKLCKLWNTFGFDVVVFNDKTYHQMTSILSELVVLNYSNYDIFICCILSHGHRDSFYTSDNIPVDICDEMIYKFNSSDVPLLKGKPKIFFIQACQGEKIENVKVAQGERLEMDSVGSNVNYSTNSMRDMAWVVSAIPSYKSFRDTENGSWFINSIVDVFNEHGTTMELRQLIDLVNDDVSNKSGLYGKRGIVTQMPSFTITTFRALHLKKMVDCSSLRRTGCLQNCPLPLQRLYGLADAIYPL